MNQRSWEIKDPNDPKTDIPNWVAEMIVKGRFCAVVNIFSGETVGYMVATKYGETTFLNEGDRVFIWDNERHIFQL